MKLKLREGPKKKQKKKSQMLIKPQTKVNCICMKSYSYNLVYIN